VAEEIPFDWITPDLAVGGCFHPHTPQALRAMGVQAVIDLRQEACDDGAALRSCGLRFLHLPTPDMQAVSVAGLEQGVAFAEWVRGEGRRLLIHCQWGIGRSALLALCVLVARGWSPRAALNLAKDRRERVSPSEAQYRAWAAWLARRQAEHGGDWDIPDFDAFAAVAYRHLATT
jgi:hypothetical protein